MSLIDERRLTWSAVGDIDAARLLIFGNKNDHRGTSAEGVAVNARRTTHGPTAGLGGPDRSIGRRHVMVSENVRESLDKAVK